MSGTPIFMKTRLPNGIRVVTETHPRNRAASVGIWVNTGTRDEKSKEAGVSHFVEHLVFKRTKSRNAFQIAREMEAVGGDLNAFTSREYTCFTTHSLKEHLNLSIDVLSDLACRATFVKDEYDREKQVILQEIHMAEDQLEDFVYDLYFEEVFKGSSLGLPILGTEKSLLEMKRADVLDYYKCRYVSENLIVSVTGAVDHNAVVDLVEKHLRPFPSRGVSSHPPRKKPKFKPFRKVITKPSEQVHILVGLPASSFSDELRFEAYVVNTLLGGGMTSKLYQSVREDRGLVYSIYSSLTSFTDCGLKTIYAGTEAKNVQKVLSLIIQELVRLKKSGISKKDLELFKTQVTGQILLGADDIENRMNSLGVNEMVFEKYRSVDDVMADVAKVSLESVNRYIEKYLDLEQLGILLLGAYKQEDAKWLASLG